MSDQLSHDERAELLALRERVAALEAERTEEIRRAAAAVANAQARAYWLDRWHIDLNAWMVTAWGERFRAAVRALRSVVRAARLTKRRLTR